RGGSRRRRARPSPSGSVEADDAVESEPLAARARLRRLLPVAVEVADHPDAGAHAAGELIEAHDLQVRLVLAPPRRQVLRLLVAAQRRPPLLLLRRHVIDLRSDRRLLRLLARAPPFPLLLRLLLGLLLLLLLLLEEVFDAVLERRVLAGA